MLVQKTHSRAWLGIALFFAKMMFVPISFFGEGYLRLMQAEPK